MTATPWRLVVHAHGGPEAIERESFDPGAPGPGQVRIRVIASGVNFIDVYHRIGLYQIPLPAPLGCEGAGIVEAVGSGVTHVAPGDQVTSLLVGRGSYATHFLAPADRTIKLPENVPAELAAALLLKGLTAWMLLERCSRAGPGKTILIHAAAGGTGSIVTRWAKELGARVIAHAGSPAKAELARAAGADIALCSPFEMLAEDVRAATEGKGADIVLDGVGAASWNASLASIAKRGMIVSFGNSSGPVPPVAPLDLLRAGSVFLTRPSMFDYVDSQESFLQGASRLLHLIGEGLFRDAIGQRFALDDAADAHRALEGRRTTGSTVLLAPA